MADEQYSFSFSYEVKLDGLKIQKGSNHSPHIWVHPPPLARSTPKLSRKSDVESGTSSVLRTSAVYCGKRLIETCLWYLLYAVVGIIVFIAAAMGLKKFIRMFNF